MFDEETTLGNLLWQIGVTDGPNKAAFHTKHYAAVIGIGKDHTATLYIDEESLKTLCERQGMALEDVVK